MVGINHIALAVGDVDEAVEFYGRIFDLELRGRVHGMAFLDMGDQFLALAEGDDPVADRRRHFGLVVDDRGRVRKALQDAGVEIEPGRGLHFRDPWGNLVEVVQYSEVQFTKAAEVLAGMDLGGLHKSEKALKELAEKGLAG
jgi:catechol 2,3-dioxygenase-like lactoylglutathione lyase family enzyme